MPKDLHRYSRMNVEGGKQRAAHLPGAMHGDAPHSGFTGAELDVPRLDDIL
jgi:hypothetical protein